MSIKNSNATFCVPNFQTLCMSIFCTKIVFFSVHLKSNVTKSPLVIFGIPTVARQSEFYLFKTLFSLKKHLKKSEESQCQFVIQISEVNESKALQMIDTLNKTFHSDIQEGLIEVILIDTLYYPTISTVSKTKESAERVYWRTKQNLDLIYLMWFCSQRKNSTFYVQLEDDIITRVSYYILVFLEEFCAMY